MNDHVGQVMGLNILISYSTPDTCISGSHITCEVEAWDKSVSAMTSYERQCCRTMSDVWTKCSETRCSDTREHKVFRHPSRWNDLYAEAHFGGSEEAPKVEGYDGSLEGSVGNGNLMRWAAKYDHLPVLGDENLKTDDMSHESQKATCKNGSKRLHNH